MGKVSGKQEN